MSGSTPIKPARPPQGVSHSLDPILPDVRSWHGFQRRDLAFLAMMPALLLCGMNSTFTDLARPFAMSELSSDRYRYQWVPGCTLLGSVIGMAVMPWCRNHFGLKNTFVAGLVVFTVGSLACGLTLNVEMLGAARFIQSVGNGLVVTTVLAILWREFPDHRDGAIAAYVLGLYFGRIFAPSFAGYLINTISWRSIFYFNGPVAGVAAVLNYHLLQDDEPRDEALEPFDWEGLILLVGFVICLEMGLFRFQKWGWQMSNEFWAVSTAGAWLLSWFLYHEWTCSHPLLDLRLFKLPRFTLAVAIKAMCDMTFFSVLSLLVTYMAVTRDYERWNTGLTLLPGVVAMSTALALTSWLGRRSDRKARLLAGVAGLILGTWLLSSIDLYTDKFWIACYVMLWASSAGVVASPLICISQEEMTPPQIASSAGIKNMMLVLPAFIGGNVVSIFIERRSDAHFDSMRQSMIPNRPPVDDVRRDLIDYFTLHGLDPSEAASQAARLLGRYTKDYATVYAYQSVLQMIALVMFGALILAFLLRPLPPHASGPSRG
ncbi:MFS transporter [Paludisphaera rhizosphaerae]|uniref:MFS transporter n=1 Tax=Paludisphaera rhizosphaerae TaxID=2711216 RepID=UPI0013EBCC6A|nr:MFS transporter [Paludisphaera rhizosphaerae]